jgi:Zn-dependent protease with chaperone function
VRAALLLLAYAAALTAVGMLWLRQARWTDRAPRIGLFAWQAISASVVASVALAGLAVAVPVSAVSGGLADLLHACATALRARYATPGGAVVAVAGALVAVGTLVRIGYCLATTWRSGRRERRRQLEALALVGRTRAHGAVVVDHDEASVYCLPGRHGRIVLTSAALHLLEPDELRAVLAHERAHLRQRHHVAVTVATALVRAFPGVRFLSVARDEIARLAELAADDAACRAVGALPLAEALLTVGGSSAPAPALAAGGSHAGRRIRRLLTPIRRLGAVRALLALTLAAVALALPLLMAAQPAFAAGHENYCPVGSAEPHRG